MNKTFQVARSKLTPNPADSASASSTRPGLQATAFASPASGPPALNQSPLAQLSILLLVTPLGMDLVMSLLSLLFTSPNGLPRSTMPA